MNWYVADKEYIKYLEKFDSRVGYVDYGDHLKLHLGILLELKNAKYYVPISSYKVKHKDMSNSLDFHKVKDENTGVVYAVLNLNNMIPIPDEHVTQLKYNEVERYRSFANEKEKTDYILYQKCLENPKGKLSQRCCNFALLEEKSKEYKSGAK